MKNRNDDKKYILGQYRQIEIKRLFNRLEQIQNRQPKTNQAIIKRMFDQNGNRLAHIPRNRNQQRLYQIRKENQRLVQKLSTTKMTVISHRQPQGNGHSYSHNRNRSNKVNQQNNVGSSTNKKNNKIGFRATFRQKQIDIENKRLYRAIRRISSQGTFTPINSLSRCGTGSLTKFVRVK